MLNDAENVGWNARLTFQVYFLGRFHVEVKGLIAFGLVDGRVIPKSNESIDTGTDNLLILEHKHFDGTIVARNFSIDADDTFDQISLPKQESSIF